MRFAAWELERFQRSEGGKYGNISVNISRHLFSGLTSLLRPNEFSSSITSISRGINKSSTKCPRLLALPLIRSVFPLTISRGRQTSEEKAFSEVVRKVRMPCEPTVLVLHLRCLRIGSRCVNYVRQWLRSFPNCVTKDILGEL